MTRAILLASTLSIGLGLTGSAWAYTVQQVPGPCLSSPPPAWTGGSPAVNHPMQYPCYNQSSIGFLGYTAYDDAAAWAMWMWEREGLLNAQVYLDHTACDTRFSGTSDGTWYTNFDSHSDIWFESSSQQTFYANTTLLGQTKYTYDPNPALCYTFPGTFAPHISEMDVTLRTDVTGQFASVNSLARCFTEAFSTEHSALHEMGHVYGLEHFDSWFATMNTTDYGAHHCNVGSGFHDEPYADESQGVSYLYSTSLSGKYNMSGAPYFQNSSGTPTIDSPVTMLGMCSNIAVSQTLTYFNHYSAVTNVPMRFELFDSAVSNPATGSPVWVGSTGTFAGQAGATYPVNVTGTVPFTAMSHGVTFRLWMHIDPLNATSETDEGDNFVPFQTLISRGSSC